MAIKTISSREFNQNVSEAKRDSMSGPVFITNRGSVAYVLLTFNDYQQLSGKKEDIVGLIGMKGEEYIEFEPEKFDGPLYDVSEDLD